MNKFQFLKMYGRLVTLTNLVSNGDMASTTGWQHYSTFSTESIVGGELKSLRNTNRPYVGTTSTWSIATGHKVYYASKAYGSKSGTMYMALYTTFGSAGVGDSTCSLTTGAQRFSAISTISGTANGLTFDGSSFTSSGDYIMLDKAIVIDLTAAFGSGREPILAQMDAWLSRFTDSWFDGTTTIII